MATYLEFVTFSGGTIRINLDRCTSCTTKACIAACDHNGRNGILALADGRPQLKVMADEARRGACTECLGCEMDCHLLGQQAVTIQLPMSGLDDYLDHLLQQGNLPPFPGNP